MRYLVVDLEATCWDKEDPIKSSHEIIEIGATLLDKNYHCIDTFDMFVHPKNNYILSDYCKNLTTIKQTEVSCALYFPVIMFFLGD